MENFVFLCNVKENVKQEYERRCSLILEPELNDRKKLR